MKVLLSWMQEFAPIPDDVDLVAAELTDLGMVVESVETVGASLDGVVVAKVLELGPHPKADRIQLVQVDAGDGQPLQICCGAFNMAVGDLVPLATIGTTMASGMEIAARQLRGEDSNGMLCSASELELPETKGVDGILVLEPVLTIGQPLAEALDQKTDTVFDLDIEGNRPDALSVVGVTRDLAARLGLPFSLPQPAVTETAGNGSALASLNIENEEFCPRFGVRVLTDVTVGESPAWMQQRLAAAGMRPINAIVDISNYVMLELGQPNHTYDLDLVPEGALVVRKAAEGETITTLDDVKRTLTAEDGVITNNAGEAIGLAGVMGGASTEISSDTSNVLLEAAVWDRMPIAWTARRLNLRSEASTRFERGVDPYGIELALDRFAELAIEICGASVVGAPLIADGELPERKPVSLRIERLNKILNLSLSAPEVTALLEPIGFASVDNNDGTLLVTIPSWRHDASIEADLIEEVARHHGYAKSGVRVPTPTQAGSLSETQTQRRRLRRALLSSGYSEAMPMPFISQADLEAMNSSASSISIAEPLVAEESILRPSLLPGLLKAVAYNQTHQIDDVKLYELGHVFSPSSEDLPTELETIAAVASGFSPSGSDSNTTSGTAAEHAVRSLYTIAAVVGLEGLAVRNAAVEGLHPNRSADVIFRGQVVGHVGEVDPTVLEKFNIANRVSWLELRTETVLAAMASVAKYRFVSRFPSSSIDLAILTPVEESAIDVARTIKKAGDGIVKAVDLFDVFRSEELGDDVRSLAYNIRLQAADKTLTDGEVAEIRQSCIDAVGKAHNATLR